MGAKLMQPPDGNHILMHAREPKQPVYQGIHLFLRMPGFVLTVRLIPTASGCRHKTFVTLSPACRYSPLGHGAETARMSPRGTLLI